ncbi:MAG TPA: metallophosphoesterase [Mycobacteriales bacterium]|nr:metallophosphoesterase [Mycobacteriales bacterium]
MKLLVVSDLHYRLPQFDWLLAAAVDRDLAIDAVVIAGDLLDIRSAVPVGAQIHAVTAQLAALGARTEVLVASGNHDLDSRDSAGEKAARWLSRTASPTVHTDAESVLVDGTLITVCPWWDGPQGRASLADRLAVDAARPKRDWVWIYHAPPTGSPLAWDGRREYGDEALTEWLPVFNPAIVLAGHIHQAPFVDGGGWAQHLGDTWIFNPGHQPGHVPAHILLDLGARTACWRSATAAEEIALS